MFRNVTRLRLPEKIETGQLSAIMTSVFFLMIIITGISVLIFERRDFTEALVHKGRSLAQFLSKVAPPSLLVYDISQLDSYVNEIGRDPEILYVTVSQREDYPISIYLDRTSPFVLPLTQSDTDPAQLIRELKTVADMIELEEPILLGDQRLGTVRIGLTKQVLKKRINQEGMAVVIVTLIGVLIAYIHLTLVNRALQKQVKSRTEELESFVYTVSHDLKSPVVSMQGMASLFMQDYQDRVDEKGRYYLNRVISNANFMEELINGLLSLSRVGKRQENPERVPVREVLQGILTRHREPLMRRGIKAVIQAPLPEFVFDRIRMTQVFENLITNAMKFMGEQTQPEIEIGGKEEKGWVEFYVKDNGIGIDPSYHNKIFGVFQRLKDVEVEGTGVGLAIVKKIVELAGGTIRLESDKGKGTTFRFRLPKDRV